MDSMRTRAQSLQTGHQTEQRTAGRVGKNCHLFNLAKGLRASEDVLLTIVPLFSERPHGNGGNVSFVDRREGCATIGPMDDIAGTDLQAPPHQGIAREAARPQERPLKAGPLNQVFDIGVHLGDRVVLFLEVVADRRR